MLSTKPVRFSALLCSPPAPFLVINHGPIQQWMIFRPPSSCFEQLVSFDQPHCRRRLSADLASTVGVTARPSGVRAKPWMFAYVIRAGGSIDLIGLLAGLVSHIWHIGCRLVQREMQRQRPQSAVPNRSKDSQSRKWQGLYFAFSRATLS